MIDSRLRIVQITQPYLFKNDAVLAQLPASELQLLRDGVKPRNAKRGEILFRQGEFPKGVFWLMNGKVKIYQETMAGEHQTMYIYSDGELIAYRQLIAKEAHPVSAALLENSTVGFIPAKLFLDLLETSPVFARNVRVALARDFTVWMNRMTVFAQYPVRRRLILALLILHEQYYRSGSPGGVITIARTELAEYVGASLETVVRALNTLKSKNLVRVNARNITLSDPLELIDLLQRPES